VDWARLVEIVRAFETGRPHAYCEEMLNFHYTPSVQKRLRALADESARRAEPATRTQDDTPGGCESR
jgi:hypothetical protein